MSCNTGAKSCLVGGFSTSCVPGYGLNNGVCSACTSANTYSCDSTLKTTACYPGFYIDSNNAC